MPNGDYAIVDPAKLLEYVLSAHHPRGRHKARVFASALGLGTSDAEFLRNELLRAAREENALEGEQDDYGQRYIIDFKCVRADRTALVRSHWIILATEDSPRLVTCFVL